MSLTTTSQSQKNADEEIYTWTIVNYANLYQSNIISSPRFFGSGDREKRIGWKLTLNPKHYENNVDYVLVQLQCESSATPDILIKYKISINANGKEYPITECGTKKLNEQNRANFAVAKFSKSDIKARTQPDYHYNDDKNSLAVVCKWRIIEVPAKIDSSDVLILRNEMRLKWKTFMETGKLCDVTLVAGEREFKAHKIILATHSSVFSAMFEHDMKEQNLSRVDITDIDADVLEEVLNYIYTHESKKLDIFVKSLLIAADKYDIKALKDLCEKSLWEIVKIKNSVDILLLADRCDAANLKKKVIRFIVENAYEIVKENIDLSLNDPSHVQLMSEIFRQLASQNKE